MLRYSDLILNYFTFKDRRQDAGAMWSVAAGVMWSVAAGAMCWFLGIIMPLRGPSCKLRLARISARLKMQDGPSVAITRNK